MNFSFPPYKPLDKPRQENKLKLILIRSVYIIYIVTLPSFTIQEFIAAVAIRFGDKI